MAEPSESVGFSIRMPRTLREQVDRFAEAEGISSARQIIRFVEAGIRGAMPAAGASPDGQALAMRIEQAEKLTGQSWREDTRTHAAAKELVARFMDEARPAPVNREEIIACWDRLKQAKEKLTGTLAALQSAGVVRPRTEINALGIGAGLMAGRPPITNALISRYSDRVAANPTKLGMALDFNKLELAVDENADAVSWPLVQEDGEPYSDDDKLGFRAMLAMVVPFFERENKERERYLEAWAEDERAINEGQELVRELPPKE